VKSVLIALSFVSLVSLAGCMDPATEHRVRGNAHFREGDYKGAIAEYDEGLKAKPNDAATLILKGNAQYELGALDDAYASYKAAFASDPTAADAVRGMALIATKRGDLDDAAKQFETLLGMPKHEHDSATRVNLAKIYLAQNKLDLAEKQAVEAGHENGVDETVLFTLGRVYLAEDKLAEARATFQHLVDTNPAKASGPYGLAMVSAKEGKKDEMLQELGAALQKGVPDPKQIPTEAAFAAYKDDPQFVAAIAPAPK
jgi:tetratricopeptide (TPR) repeat protein